MCFFPTAPAVGQLVIFADPSEKKKGPEPVLIRLPLWTDSGHRRGLLDPLVDGGWLCVVCDGDGGGGYF